jgi:CRP-like cAMP-binding protein
MQQLITFISQYSKLSPTAIEALEKRIEFESFHKNEIILSQGAKANKVWFIKKGMVRKFFYNEGKEITIWIHAENEMLTSMHSYFQQKPSQENIQAIEDTELISLSYEKSLELSVYPEFNTFSQDLITKQFSCIDEFSKKFSLMSAKEKYVALSEIAPQIIKRAKLGYIASILGISQETLSRIRSKR